MLLGPLIQTTLLYVVIHSHRLIKQKYISFHTIHGSHLTWWDPNLFLVWGSSVTSNHYRISQECLRSHHHSTSTRSHHSSKSMSPVTSFNEWAPIHITMSRVGPRSYRHSKSDSFSHDHFSRLSSWVTSLSHESAPWLHHHFMRPSGHVTIM